MDSGPNESHAWITRFVIEARRLGCEVDAVMLYVVAAEALQRPDAASPEAAARLVFGTAQRPPSDDQRPGS